MVATLQPQWVILRPVEAARPEFARNHVLDAYQLVKNWDGARELDAVKFLPGRPWCEFESRYQLYRRRPAAAPGA